MPKRMRWPQVVTGHYVVAEITEDERLHYWNGEGANRFFTPSMEEAQKFTSFGSARAVADRLYETGTSEIRILGVTSKGSIVEVLDREEYD